MQEEKLVLWKTFLSVSLMQRGTAVFSHFRNLHFFGGVERMVKYALKIHTTPHKRNLWQEATVPPFSIASCKKAQTDLSAPIKVSFSRNLFFKKNESLLMRRGESNPFLHLGLCFKSYTFPEMLISKSQAKKVVEGRNTENKSSKFRRSTLRGQGSPSPLSATQRLPPRHVSRVPGSRKQRGGELRSEVRTTRSQAVHRNGSLSSPALPPARLAVPSGLRTVPATPEAQATVRPALRQAALLGEGFPSPSLAPAARAKSRVSPPPSPSLSSCLWIFPPPPPSANRMQRRGREGRRELWAGVSHASEHPWHMLRNRHINKERGGAAPHRRFFCTSSRRERESDATTLAHTAAVQHTRAMGRREAGRTLPAACGETGALSRFFLSPPRYTHTHTHARQGSSPTGVPKPLRAVPGGGSRKGRTRALSSGSPPARCQSPGTWQRRPAARAKPALHPRLLPSFPPSPPPLRAQLLQLTLAKPQKEQSQRTCRRIPGPGRISADARLGWPPASSSAAAAAFSSASPPPPPSPAARAGQAPAPPLDGAGWPAGSPAFPSRRPATLRRRRAASPRLSP